ncbi:hypothetical protein NHQ30_006232 [Ciborinia camelliae]|nr:hypothetical protein NHQ30_006232 [Ciborinia camelliae]
MNMGQRYRRNRTNYWREYLEWRQEDIPDESEEAGRDSEMREGMACVIDANKVALRINHKLTRETTEVQFPISDIRDAQIFNVELNIDEAAHLQRTEMGRDEKRKEGCEEVRETFYMPKIWHKDSDNWDAKRNGPIEENRIWGYLMRRNRREGKSPAMEKVCMMIMYVIGDEDMLKEEGFQDKIHEESETANLIRKECYTGY